MAPERIDRYLGSHPDVRLSRTRIQKLITDGLVTVDDETTTTKYVLKGGEHICITVPAAAPSELTGEDIPLEIVYQDEYLAVVNKPAGMVTHPGAGNRSGTLVNALIHHLGRLPLMGETDRPGIVHRLDKNTTGLLVVAKTEESFKALQEAIFERKVHRTYIVLVCGHMLEDRATIDLPIGRSTRDRKKMSVAYQTGKEAKTGYKLTERFRSYDLLEASLFTGRTHQIRVHFSHLGHPVFGDQEYGGREKWLRGLFGPERPLARKMLRTLHRQALHAHRLEFEHPVTGEKLRFEADLPGDFQKILRILRSEGR